MTIDSENHLGKGGQVERRPTGLVADLDIKSYPGFRRSPKAVLVLKISGCYWCGVYDDVLSQLAQVLPDVRFGRVVLDRTGSHFRKLLGADFGESIYRPYPHTFVIEKGVNRGDFEGAASTQEAIDRIRYLFRERPALRYPVTEKPTVKEPVAEGLLTRKPGLLEALRRLARGS